MDMLYHNYNNPHELMQMYIDNCMFSDFVTQVLQKNDDRKMWELYLHSQSDLSFIDWKNKVTKQSTDTSKMIMSNQEVNKQLDVAHNILQRFKP